MTELGSVALYIIALLTNKIITLTHYILQNPEKTLQKYQLS